MKPAYLVFLGVCFLSMPSSAQTVDPIFGAGTISCSSWLTSRASNDANVQEEWVVGNLSGLIEVFQDFLHKDVTYYGVGDQIFSAIDSECTSNRAENLNMATIHVFMNSGDLFALQSHSSVTSPTTSAEPPSSQTVTTSESPPPPPLAAPSSQATSQSQTSFGMDPNNPETFPKDMTCAQFDDLVVKTPGTTLTTDLIDSLDQEWIRFDRAYSGQDPVEPTLMNDRFKYAQDVANICQGNPDKPFYQAAANIYYITKRMLYNSPQ